MRKKHFLELNKVVDIWKYLAHVGGEPTIESTPRLPLWISYIRELSLYFVTGEGPTTRTAGHWPPDKVVW